MLHSDPSSGHTERTSIAILCHEASKSLCPSNKLAIPALPLHGSNFRKGVKFSVQTTSLGSVPCRRYRLSEDESGILLAGSNVIRGLVVLVESMKLSEAQNKPDRALFSVTHLANDLLSSQSQVTSSHLVCYLLLTQSPNLLLPKPTVPRLFPLLSFLPMALRPSSQRPICRY